MTRLCPACGTELTSDFVSSGTPVSDRERIDAILAHLREIHTEEGVWVWLAGRKRSLDGERPVDHLKVRDFGAVERILPALDQVAT